MDTDLIRTFLTLAQCNSFSTAAEKLTISQSTLSHRLHQLEEELGNILVCRSRGYFPILLLADGDDDSTWIGKW